MEPTDETLCRRIAAGDQAAFDLLVARWQRRAWRLAWSIVRDAEDARDLSQEAFVRLYQRAGQFDGRARFSTWFYRLIVNVCLDHHRRGWWRRLLVPGSDGDGPDALLSRLPAPPSDPAEDLQREQTMKRIWAAVAGLPARQRAALVLQVQEGLETPEIAQALGCSETTVRVHLHRALTTLRKRLGTS